MAGRGKFANIRYAAVGLGPLAQEDKDRHRNRTGDSSISARQTENCERQVAFRGTELGR